jgi:methylmalonyl-CoA/ethylmalonyl-CoA epimerase
MRALVFHHIGLAARSLEQERQAHLLLGFEQEGEIFHDPVQQINGVFMRHRNMRIEIVEPAGGASPILEILRRGHKMYHQCFECTDIHTTIDILLSEGAHVLKPPVPAVAFQGRSIAFLIMPTLLMVELIEQTVM